MISRELYINGSGYYDRTMGDALTAIYRENERKHRKKPQYMGNWLCRNRTLNRPIVG